LSVTGLNHEDVVGRLKACGTVVEIVVNRHKNRVFMKLHDYRHLTITRESKDVSFGFSMACYQDEDGDRTFQSHAIEVVVPGGLADGIVQVGDELVELNGTIVQQLQHEDVIERIKSSLTLDLAVQRKKETHVQELTMKRGASTVPWGVSFETAELEDGTPIGHYVSNIKTAGIADDAGICVDHEVLTVNGEGVRDMDHTTFITLFRDVKSVIVEVIAETHKAFDHETVDVVLEKTAGESFGFAIYESDGFHFVETVVDMSVAANKLEEYDEIESVNGTAVKGMSHDEVVAILTAGNRAELVVHRHPLDPAHGVNKTLSDETEAALRKDVEFARSRLEMQRALELAMVDFTKPAPAAPAAPAPPAPPAPPAAPASQPVPAAFDEASREQMQGSLESAIEEYGERGAAPQGGAATANATATAADEGVADDDDDDSAHPEPPTSPVSNFPTSPISAVSGDSLAPKVTAQGSALKLKIAARRAAAGAAVDTPEKSSTPLKDRIAARAAAAKTVDAGSAQGSVLSPVGSVDPVDPNRKKEADEAFMSTFGLKLEGEEE